MDKINIRRGLFSLFPRSEERDAERSDGRVSKLCSMHLASAFGANFASTSTHPNIASLVHPLFRKRERGLAAAIFNVLNTKGLKTVAMFNLLFF